MLFNTFLLLAGLVGLVFSSDQFVGGAISVAKKFRLSDLVIGGSIVAIGTSAPELAINVTAAIKKEGDVLISNIVGSNIVNICLGIGVALLLIEMKLERFAEYRIYLFGLFGAIILFSSFYFSLGGGLLKLPQYAGVFLLTGFVLYLFLMGGASDEKEIEIGNESILLAAVRLIGGCVALIVFANIVVDSAVEVARLHSIPEAVIGATFVAAGGSLPEVAACISAAKLQKPSIVIGTIGGSQIFNIFGVLGVSLLFGDVTFSDTLRFDIAFLVCVTVFLTLIPAVTRKSFGMKAGILLVVFYFGYLAYLGNMAAHWGKLE